MKVLKLAENIIYIENAFPQHKDFIDALENKLVGSIIKNWEPWEDVSHDGLGNPIISKRGSIKQIDWDFSINDTNKLWPRIEIQPEYSEDHTKAYEILKMIHEPYLNALDIWSQKTGNEMPTIITKNYTIKKYDIGGEIGEHVDIVLDDPYHTMDWTVLIYLNDNYKGGDLVFTNHNITLSPSAGSILFFPTCEPHSAMEVTHGNKYFIFLYLHTKYKLSHSVNELYVKLVKNIENN
jgi:predicted 2-oxoglutarate/Fe(II)-dependent dioxygenase YbiX